MKVFHVLLTADRRSALYHKEALRPECLFLGLILLKTGQPSVCVCEKMFAPAVLFMGCQRIQAGYPVGTLIELHHKHSDLVAFFDNDAAGD